jgi:hypothetical protein
LSNTTYTASLRQGGRSSCGPGMRRISVTVTEDAFLALRRLADAAHRGLSGEAAIAIERHVADASEAVTAQSGGHQ